MALATLLLVAAAATAAEPRDLDLPAILARSPVVVLAEVDDPRLDVIELPLAPARRQQPGAVPPPATWQRMRRHFVRQDVLRGRAPARLLVDEPAWRTSYAAAVACAAGRPCRPTVGERFRGSLAREPIPGSRVVLFLRPGGAGQFELAAEFAIESADRLAEIRAAMAPPARRAR